MKRLLRLISLPAFVAMSALILTILAFFFTRRSIQDREQLAFRTLSLQIKTSIDSRMRTYVNSLVQTRSMFFVTREVDREEFRNYVHNLNLLKEYPGIQGIGYALRISPEALKKHVQKVREEGFPNYQVWPTDKRSEYFSILYLEPFNWRNRKAFGFDMFTEPNRRSAMMTARDSGLPAISERVTLVQETHRNVQYGFLIYIPVYNSMVLPKTPLERQQALTGFVYSPFRSKDLFEDIFSHLDMSEVWIQVYQNYESQENLLYSSEVATTQERGKFSKTYSINVANKSWIIKTHSLVGPKTNRDLSAWFILALGLLFTCLLFWIILKHQKYSLAEIERSQHYQTLNQLGKILSAELNLEKLVESVAEAGLKLSRGSHGIFLYLTQNETGEKKLAHRFTGITEETPQKMSRALDAGLGEKITTIVSDLADGGEIRSFLSVPVISRSSEVIGRLIFAHERPAVFGEREQVLVEGLASQAAIAMDNAHLHKKSQDAIAARDEFLSIASHELKTPITSMKLLFQMARKALDRNDPKVFEKETTEKRIFLANAQLDRMSKLVNDMLETSRFSSNKLDLNLEILDLRDVIKNVLDALQHQLQEQGVFLQYQERVKVPLIEGDRHRIEQVFTNLITNAMKYGQNLPVEVFLEEKNDQIILRVRDQGMGIPSEKLDKIFNRFERAITSHHISGLGLGLYISKEIISAHRGSIRVQSVEGEGATFVVQFPKYIEQLT